MATGSTTTNSSISLITDHCVAAEAKYGGNGGAGGQPEVGVGHDSSDAQTARRTWDANPADGIDSGTVAVLCSAEAGGGANGVSWSVAGSSANPVVYTGRTYGAVEKVKVRAGVRVGGRAEWSELQVRFYRSGRLTETYTQSAGPAVDTTAGPGTAAEAILTVTPANTNNTKVTVSGYVRLGCPEGTVPGPDDLLAQVFVYAANCAAP